MECVADQQRLFRLGERQRRVAQVCPAVTQVDRLPGMGMAFEGALLKTRQRIGIQ